MQKVIVTITVLLIIVSCSQQRNKSSIEQRILGIENGLIEFKSIDKVFQPDSLQLANPKSLDERMKHYNTPGVSIAVINNNQLEWAKAYGIMDVNTGKPVTSETIFEAGSVSKFLTSVLVLHFVQKGLIDLDIDVNKYLKSWHVPENEFTLKEKVTLRRLLTHQAGLPDTHYDSDESVEYPTLIDVLNGKHGLNEAAIPEYIPGSKWQYSNIGYNVIQLLLKDILGKPFQQIAEEIIFKPLGMNNSTFVYPLDADKKVHEAMPHDIKGISRETLMHLTALAHGGLT
ncbi:beta-lactamase family protein, partial [bacterium]|nr:beta-lactamase family protein [bacterium]